jgi:spore coat protein A
MNGITRRELLALAGTAGLAAASIQRAIAAAGALDRVPKFARPLPALATLHPVKQDATTDHYEIEQREAQVEILPGLRTTIWGYEGRFPGPTIHARRGRTTVVRHTNRLRVPTVVHLHGGVTPSDSDGFPTEVIPPGGSKTYTYPNEGRAATLWYHDHAMDATGRNVYMGLAGLYIVRDPAEDALRLPSGRYDVPLVIQDRLLDRPGALVYDPFRQLAAKGGTLLVNGAPWPRLEVAARKYRFRIVNASNATPLQLRLDSGAPLTQIATEGGLLASPVALATLPLSMAERADVVIDFSRCPIGSRIHLQNLHTDDLSGAYSRDVMRFDVARSEPDDSQVPERLGGDMPALAGQAASRTREFSFTGGPQLTWPPRARWRINGSEFDAGRPIATPHYGDVEIWHLRNRALLGVLGLVHPVHLHLVTFQIVERDGGVPGLHERGWKDTVAVPAGSDVRIAARFEGYRGRYVMHCHNLEHEDHSMMARYDVV